MAADWDRCHSVVRRLATPHLRVGDGDIRRMVDSGLRRDRNRRKERGGTSWTHLGRRWSWEILAATEAVSRQGRATRNAVGWRSRRGWCRRRQWQTERERRRRHRETAGGGWALPLSLTRGRPSHSHCAVPSRRGAWASGRACPLRFCAVLHVVMMVCQGGAALVACRLGRRHGETGAGGPRHRWAVGGPGLCRCAGCTTGHLGAVGCGIGGPSGDAPRPSGLVGWWAGGLLGRKAT